MQHHWVLDAVCPPFPYTAFVRAPKKRIGGSGPFAGLLHALFLPHEYKTPALSLPDSASLCQQNDLWRVVADTPLQQEGDNTLSCFPLHFSMSSRFIASADSSSAIHIRAPKRGIGGSGPSAGMFWFRFVAGFFIHVPAFFVHLLWVLFWALCSLLLRPLGVHKTPLGQVCLLPARGIPAQVLLPFARLTARSWPAESAVRSTGKRRKVTGAGLRRPCVPRRWLLWPSLFMSLPVQVWATPELWGEAVNILIAAARLYPEPMDMLTCAAPVVPSSTATSFLEALEEDFELACSLQRHTQLQILETPLHNNEFLPAPPVVAPQHPDDGVFIQAYCYVMAPCTRQKFSPSTCVCPPQWKSYVKRREQHLDLYSYASARRLFPRCHNSGQTMHHFWPSLCGCPMQTCKS